MKYKIFVSGVQKELKSERFAIKELVEEDILLEEYFSVFLFEKAPAGGKPPKSIYLREVCDCDVYIVIFGDEYGKTAKDKPSATEEEFKEAQKRSKYILVYIKGKIDDTKDKRVKKLISEIRDATSGYKYVRFENTLELKNAIHESLIEFLREKGIVGKTIFDE